jgi:hypothetical protein
MDILVHTYGRADKARQTTVNELMADGITPTLVVQASEADLYGWFPGRKIVLPFEIRQLSPTRDWLIHHCVGDDKVVFLDDDLHFFCRRGDDRTKFRIPRKNDLVDMMGAIERALEVCPHVGIAPREGGNRNTEQHLRNTRLMRVLGYRRDYLRKHALHFTPLVVMEDFHMNLQIMESGADTLMLNNWCSNQSGGSDAPGGCSTYRSSAVQTASAHLLHSLHPRTVRVVEKATKTAWGGGTRTDVVMQWKRARAGV